MPRLLAIIAFVLLAAPLPAQLFVGPNFGPAWGRTADAQVLLFPKNEDWLAFSLSGGYTFEGMLYFPRKKAECIDYLRHGGWHIRLGARNGFTVDHHDNHFFWGLDLVYSRQNESMSAGDCSLFGAGAFSQEVHVLSGALNAGWTWNPLKGKTIYQHFLIDFGLRVGYPFWSSAPLLSERDYISGVGMTWLPFRSIAFEPIVVFRWELFHGRYGYFKGRTRKRFYD